MKKADKSSGDFQPGPERRWLKISEASTYLSIHKKTCYDLASRGLLPTARIGGSLRVDRFALDQNLERQSQAKQPKGRRS